MLFRVPVGVGERVAMLDQEPLVLAAGFLKFHQNKAPAQLFAVEMEFQFSTSKLVARAQLTFRCVRTLIPNDDLSAPVLALGNGSLEGPIFKGMVFDLNRQPLGAGV